MNIINTCNKYYNYLKLIFFLLYKSASTTIRRFIFSRINKFQKSWILAFAFITFPRLIFIPFIYSWSSSFFPTFFRTFIIPLCCFSRRPFISKTLPIWFWKIQKFEFSSEYSFVIFLLPICEIFDCIISAFATNKSAWFQHFYIWFYLKSIFIVFKNSYYKNSFHLK